MLKIMEMREEYLQKTNIIFLLSKNKNGVTFENFWITVEKQKWRFLCKKWFSRLSAD